MRTKIIGNNDYTKKKGDKDCKLTLKRTDKSLYIKVEIYDDTDYYNGRYPTEFKIQVRESSIPKLIEGLNEHLKSLSEIKRKEIELTNKKDELWEQIGKIDQEITDLHKTED